MKIFNSMTRKKEEFIPMQENKVLMYVCGPTVYDYIHIGNARPFVVFDTVRRYLEYKGFKVVYVQNFTDIDDKIIKRANDENTTMEKISKKYIEEARKDISLLNIKEPTYSPKVTEEVEEIIKMIEELIRKKHAYEINGNVYFNTKTFDAYGKLSKKTLEDLEIGSRISIDNNKINFSDFVLWKKRKEDEPFWNSPWGKGRPGWHIECSAMIKKYLGDSIDIHAGGEDLIFPHHENEIAQSECCNNKVFVKYWMHNGFINIDNEKMSKSKGNFFTIRDITKKYPYEVIRFFLLTSHYRSPINFSDELLNSSKKSLERIETCLKNLEFLRNNSKYEEIKSGEKCLILESETFITNFSKVMDDDFNTADAISVIFDFVKFANSHINHNSSKEFILIIYNSIDKLCSILGLSFKDDEVYEDLEKIENLIEERHKAKINKDFKKADNIRQELLNMGIMLEDTRQGVKFHKIK